MKFKLFMVGALMALAGAANAGTLYSQAYDGLGNFYASQNDTNPGGNGNFATAYDSFTLSSASNLDGFTFVGGYFNPPTPGMITQFTLELYADGGGIPGTPIAIGVFPGNDGETLDAAGNANDYAVFFQNFLLGPGTYWASIEPDLGFPPQWGWATSATGAGDAYQCFQGTCATLVSATGGGVNFAFSILGSAATVPEPAAWAMMLVGFGAVGVAIRSRRRLAAAA